MAVLGACSFGFGTELLRLFLRNIARGIRHRTGGPTRGSGSIGNWEARYLLQNYIAASRRQNVPVIGQPVYLPVSDDGRYIGNWRKRFDPRRQIHRQQNNFVGL